MIKIHVQHQPAIGADLALDLTPMLDILFIMLVFFLLTAGAVFQSLDLTLPSSVTEKLAMINEPKHIMLEIRQKGYALDNQSMQFLDALRHAISAVMKTKVDYRLILPATRRYPSNVCCRF